MGTLLTDIENFLAQTGLSEGQFGQYVLRDRKLVAQIRKGRDLRMSTVQKCRDFIATYPRKAA